MQVLRTASFLARLVLAWFALSIGVAVASPLLKPVNLELVCSGSGTMKLMVKGDDGRPASTHTLECPLCATSGAPPPVPPVAAAFPATAGSAVPCPAVTHVAATGAVPPPARAPPPFALT